MSVRGRCAVAQIYSFNPQKWVLHGSGRRRRILAPRKPRGVYTNPLHSHRWVYATTRIDLAVLYAVLGMPSCEWRWEYLPGEDGLQKLHIWLPSSVRFRRGYVHILPREKFYFPKTGSTLVGSPYRVRPIRIIPVYPFMVHAWLERGWIGRTL